MAAARDIAAEVAGDEGWQLICYQSPKSIIIFHTKNQWGTLGYEYHNSYTRRIISEYITFVEQT